MNEYNKSRSRKNNEKGAKLRQELRNFASWKIPERFKLPPRAAAAAAVAPAAVVSPGLRGSVGASGRRGHSNENTGAGTGLQFMPTNNADETSAATARPIGAIVGPLRPANGVPGEAQSPLSADPLFLRKTEGLRPNPLSGNLVNVSNDEGAATAAVPVATPAAPPVRVNQGVIVNGRARGRAAAASVGPPPVPSTAAAAEPSTKNMYVFDTGTIRISKSLRSNIDKIIQKHGRVGKKIDETTENRYGFPETSYLMETPSGAKMWLPRRYLREATPENLVPMPKKSSGPNAQEERVPVAGPPAASEYVINLQPCPSNEPLRSNQMSNAKLDANLVENLKRDGYTNADIQQQIRQIQNIENVEIKRLRDYPQVNVFENTYIMNPDIWIGTDSTGRHRREQLDNHIELMYHAESQRGCHIEDPERPLVEGRIGNVARDICTPEKPFCNLELIQTSANNNDCGIHTILTCISPHFARLNLGARNQIASAFRRHVVPLFSTVTDEERRDLVPDALLDDTLLQKIAHYFGYEFFIFETHGNGDNVATRFRFTEIDGRSLNEAIGAFHTGSHWSSVRNRDGTFVFQTQEVIRWGQYFRDNTAEGIEYRAGTPAPDGTIFIRFETDSAGSPIYYSAPAESAEEFLRRLDAQGSSIPNASGVSDVDRVIRGPTILAWTQGADGTLISLTRDELRARLRPRNRNLNALGAAAAESVARLAGKEAAARAVAEPTNLEALEEEIKYKSIIYKLAYFFYFNLTQQVFVWETSSARYAFNRAFNEILEKREKKFRKLQSYIASNRDSLIQEFLTELKKGIQTPSKFHLEYAPKSMIGKIPSAGGARRARTRRRRLKARRRTRR